MVCSKMVEEANELKLRIFENSRALQASNPSRGVVVVVIVIDEAAVAHVGVEVGAANRVARVAVEPLRVGRATSIEVDVAEDGVPKVSGGATGRNELLAAAAAPEERSAEDLLRGLLVGHFAVNVALEASNLQLVDIRVNVKQSLGGAHERGHRKRREALADAEEGREIDRRHQGNDDVLDDRGGEAKVETEASIRHKLLLLLLNTLLLGRRRHQRRMKLWRNEARKYSGFKTVSTKEAKNGAFWTTQLFQVDFKLLCFLKRNRRFFQVHFFPMSSGKKKNTSSAKKAGEAQPTLEQEFRACWPEKVQEVEEVQDPGVRAMLMQVFMLQGFGFFKGPTHKQLRNGAIVRL
jgi:hypothetical protein